MRDRSILILLGLFIVGVLIFKGKIHASISSPQSNGVATTTTTPSITEDLGGAY